MLQMMRKSLVWLILGVTLMGSLTGCTKPDAPQAPPGTTGSTE